MVPLFRRLSPPFTSAAFAALCFLGVFVFLIPYVAIQIQGIAIFLDAASDGALPQWVWSVGIVCVLLMYSEVGGLRAIIHCDAMQINCSRPRLSVIAIGVE